MGIFQIEFDAKGCSKTFLVGVVVVVVDEPVVDEPVVDEPVVDEPVVDEPVVDEPVVDEPVGCLWWLKLKF
jgi:hypothetical protein